MTQPYKVLYDLVEAGQPNNSGIPQDARLTFSALNQAPVTLTGLVRTLFGLERGPQKWFTQNERVMDNHVAVAKVIGAISEPPDFGSGGLRMLLAKIMYLADWNLVRAVLSNFFPTFPIDKTRYFDPVWRSLLAKSLAAEDYEAMQKGKLDFRLNFLSSLIAIRRSRMLPFALPEIDTKGYDFAIFQNPTPHRVSPGTIKIDRFYDAVPVFSADTIKPGMLRAYSHNVRTAARKGTDYFVCCSEPSRQELIELFPNLKDRTYVVPCVVNNFVSKLASSLDIHAIILNRLSLAAINGGGSHPMAGSLAVTADEHNKRQILASLPPDSAFDYIIALSTLEPRKNIISTIRAWERVRATHDPNLRLIIIGKPAWKADAIMDAIRPYIMQGQIIHLEALTFAEIQALLKKAKCLVSPSYAEGFNLPPVEAMVCGTPSVVSDLPIHRWVLEDAALYAKAYDVNDIATQIARLTSGEQAAELRASLMAKAPRILQRYAMETVAQQWLEVFDDIKKQKRPAISSMSSKAYAKEEESRLAA